MLLSDIARVKGYRRTQFKAWLTRRSDDPFSNLSGRPTSSHLMTTHYIREGEHRARASNSNRGARSDAQRVREGQRVGERRGNKRKKKSRGGGKRAQTSNHRPPPLIVSERKLNIDQSEQGETMKRGEIEHREQGYK